MQRRNRWLVAAMIGLALPLSGCAEVSTAAPKSESPAKVEKIGDTGLSRLTLTERAVERLDIQTAAVSEVAAVKVIPYAALLYQPNGETFVYTNPSPLTYVREIVTVQSISGPQVLLTAGPATGSLVVTTGGAELWGTEFKVGKY